MVPVQHRLHNMCENPAGDTSVEGGGGVDFAVA